MQGIQVMAAKPKKNKKFKTFDDVLLEALAYMRDITIDKARFKFLESKEMNPCASVSSRRNNISEHGLNDEFIRFLVGLSIQRNIKIDRAIALVLCCSQNELSVKAGFSANHFSSRLSRSTFLLEDIFKYIETLDEIESDWLDLLINKFDIKVNKL